MSGQTLNDRLTAAKHILAGQGLARVVCKATTEEVIGPKKKHLDYLLHCTNEPNVSIPELANLLTERTQHSSWVVVYKSLITVHHLMCYGSEKFIQCLATSTCTFHLTNFVDKTGAQGYDMSPFVRRYSRYLNAKASSYRTMGFDFCKVKRGKEEGVFRNMNTEMLLKTLPVLQEQLDALLEFDCNPDDLNNGVVNSCFMLLYRDLIQLFAAYNDGIINLFEKYFTMNKKHCREALDIYKKFIVAMDKVSDFLKVAERVGIDKGNIPDLTKAPSSLLEEMENHLTYLEEKKGHSYALPSAAGDSRSTSLQSAVSALSSTSNAFSISITSAHEVNGLTVDESLRRAVEEEAAVMNQLKERRMRELSQNVGSTDAFNSPPVSAKSSHISLTQAVPSPPLLPPPSSVITATTTSSTSPSFKPKSDPEPTSASITSIHSKASDDLLMLNNPFAQQAPAQITHFVPSGTNGFSSASASFVSESSFATAFNTQTGASSAFDAFGEVLQPKSSSSTTTVNKEVQLSQNETKLISDDLDSSIATLAQNLDINGHKKAVNSGHQWGMPKTVTKTGGANWTPATQSPSINPAWGTAGPYQPRCVAPVQWAAGMTGPVPYPYQSGVPGVLPQQTYSVGSMWMTGMGMNVSLPTQHSTTVMGTVPIQQPIMSTSNTAVVTQNPATTTNDPFGAL